MAIISDTLWPLVVVRDCGGPLADLAGALQSIAARGEYILLIATTREPRPVLEHHELLQLDLGVLVDNLLGVAALSPNNLSKNAKLALSRLDGINNLRVFGSAAPAVDWCRRLLKTRLNTSLSRRVVLAELAHVSAGPAQPAAPSLPAQTADELPPLLEAFREPAFLVNAAGTVVFRNRAAHRSHLSDAWLANVLDQHSAPTPDQECAKVMRLRGTDLYLVVPLPPWELPQAFEAVSDTWPPRLRETVELLLEGLSDREIATRLSTRPSTARTYVIRVFRRLGVHSRKQLLPWFTRFDQQAVPTMSANED
jgi:DNA-binding CsgD family transcriptional regulator